MIENFAVLGMIDLRRLLIGATARKSGDSNAKCRKKTTRQFILCHGNTNLVLKLRRDATPRGDPIESSPSCAKKLDDVPHYIAASRPFQRMEKNF